MKRTGKGGILMEGEAATGDDPDTLGTLGTLDTSAGDNPAIENIQLPAIESDKRARRPGLLPGQVDGGVLPDGPEPALLVLPGGATGPAFLVYQNYQVLLKWNHSTYFVLTVCQFADQLAGR